MVKENGYGNGYSSGDGTNFECGTGFGDENESGGYEKGDGYGSGKIIRDRDEEGTGIGMGSAYGHGSGIADGDGFGIGKYGSGDIIGKGYG